MMQNMAKMFSRLRLR